MAKHIKLTAGMGGADGYGGELPLDRELKEPIIVDASALRSCHPMYAIRLRLFLDWHAAAGHDVRLIGPEDASTAQRLANMGVGTGLRRAVIPDLSSAQKSSEALLAIHRLKIPQDVEDVSDLAMDVLHEQAPALAVWGDPVYMAVSELCSNALQHGQDALGAYVAADRVEGDSKQFRLAIADLGIGIPEHIRARHPEWQDDAGAIGRALERGVSGTGDPHRGNGFAEVLDDAASKVLVRTMSSVRVDIRSSKGRIVVDLVDGRQEPRPESISGPRRGTWITYTVTTI